MSDSRVVLAPASAPAPEPSRSAKRRRPRLIAAIAIAALLVAVAVAAVVAWPVSAAVARDGVVIRQDARPWACASGAITTQSVDDSLDDGQQQFDSLVTVTKALDCRLRIIVDNTGGRAVSIDRLTLPLFGPGSRVDIVATQLDGDFSTAFPVRTAGDDLDARFDIAGGLTVDPDTAKVLSVEVKYSKKGSGCSLSAGSSTSDFRPVVRVTSRGMTGDVVASHGWFGFAGAAGCP
ncbi:MULTISPECIES: hypothetical protein [unclassified Frondihabitans]|uniref:hypothetical protein n=1 Tax=unclassified Frondihabitans TaxID=2626248 RepID=UPI000F4FC287|nr:MULTISPECIES: hypothetical protein [unclassified Frondihabitans]RPE74265.1 hypothetical protein EDF37_3006 [Frondihabitans sp. PhB153]RPF02695.1 hypothetical protein EDF39_3074 [Frondihabitans sp. PhB161]